MNLIVQTIEISTHPTHVGGGGWGGGGFLESLQVFQPPPSFQLNHVSLSIFFSFLSLLLYSLLSLFCHTSSLFVVSNSFFLLI